MCAERSEKRLQFVSNRFVIGMCFLECDSRKRSGHVGHWCVFTPLSKVFWNFLWGTAISLWGRQCSIVHCSIVFQAFLPSFSQAFIDGTVWVFVCARPAGCALPDWHDRRILSLS